jgi:uncharacterized Zn-binding protein involved in type VI secretion
VVTPPAGRVETNSLPQARGSDRCDCSGPPDFIVTGSGTVTVGSLPAARLTDKTMHQGAVVLGAANVMIGGPTVGATLGSPGAGKQECAALAATRHTPGQKHQSYGNCGIEAWRSIINRQRAARGEPALTEDQALQRAQDLGAAGKDPAKPWAIGAGTADDRVKILADQGILATKEPSTPENVQQFVAEGRGVSVAVYPIYYWPSWTGAKEDWKHEVLVTGVEYDKHGQAKAYIINDSGLGKCGLSIPADTFDQARIAGASLVVSQDRVW